jgi:putative ABC transport system permease protein
MRLTALAWRGLAARPLRTVLTVLGIGLGVAIIAGTLVASQASADAVQRAAAELFGRAQLRVRAFADTGFTPRGITTLRRVAGVEAAAAVAQRRLTLTTDPGPHEQVFSSMLVIGVDPQDEELVRTYRLTAGRFLSGDTENEILVNARWAGDHGLGVGDHLWLGGDLRNGGAGAALTIVGLMDDTGFGALAFGQVAVLPRGILDSALAIPAPVVSVDLVIAQGHVSDVETAIDASLDEPYVFETVQDAAAQLASAQAGFAAIAFLFGLIALAVGGFLVANTMTMTLGERTREIGLLRAAGTTGGQVVGIFVRQAVALGLAGSALGVAAGIGLAALMIGFLQSTRTVLIDGLPLNPAALSFAFVVGAVTTAGAAGIPALAAARIGPLEALRPSRRPGRTLGQRLRWLIGLELLLLLVGLVAYPLGRGSLGFPALLLGLAILVGAALLVTLIVEPLAGVVGRPFQWFFGAQGFFGRAQLGRDRVRSGLTVGALLLGLAAVVTIGTVAESARATTTRWVDSILPGGYGIRLAAPVSIEQYRPTFEATSGLRYASPIVEFPAVERVGDVLTEAGMAGVDPAVFRATGSLIFTSGDRASAFDALAAGGAVLVPEPVATRDGLKVGSTLRLGIPGLAGSEFRVAGIVAYSIPSQTGEGDLLVSLSDATSRFHETDASLWAMVPQAGVGDAAFRNAVADTANQLAGQPIAATDLADTLSRSLDRIVGLFDVLAFISVIIAALGIVNTLSMGVLERVREIAILRSHGMTVGQVQAMVVTEAAIMGAIGGLAASVTGVLVAWAFVGLGAGSDFSGLAVPWVLLAIVVLLGIGVAALAGLYPARLAARLPIVGSLRHFE